MVSKEVVACFSGHRTLPQDCRELKTRLTLTIINLIKNGIVFFGAGGALGFDMLAEEVVLELKTKYPQIKLVLVLPCLPQYQTLKWNSAQKQRYYNILNRSDKVRILSEHYSSNCMLKRNRHLVDNSKYLVCYLRKNHGGTFYTVSYAEKQNLNIIRL